MKRLSYLSIAALALLAFAASCSKDDNEEPVIIEPSGSVYILNEGSWGKNNAELSRWDIDSQTLTADWYSSVNSSPLGDVGNDIVVTDNFIIMAVNSSNLIEFCDRIGKSTGRTEAVPNVRKLAVDPSQLYIYATSYADNGYVAKIQLSTFEVVDTVHVGYEPEGIVYYNDRLYVANSGGYGYNGDHDYEQSISVIDPTSMKELKRVDTGHYNLTGAFLQNSEYPRFILVNAAGDYASRPASSFIFDCDSQTVVAEYDFPATYATQYQGTYYALGSSYSYASGKFEYTGKKIAMNASGAPSVSDWAVPGISDMVAPYGVYYTKRGELLVTDAGDYVSRGKLFRYDQDGNLLSTETVGVCPGHFAED